MNSPKRSGGVVEIELIGILNGHTDRVDCIQVSQEFKIIVSGSSDGTAIIWDSNRLKYVKSLQPHKGPVVAVAIHPSTGYIVTIDRVNSGSNIYLWSINAKLIAEESATSDVRCLYHWKTWSWKKPCHNWTPKRRNSTT
eukprot:TRINITY_DN11225_c0_g1_i1.p1 TRINITY_DN11225_c0_g1~~TRINITY_DN11225_c0_g1_i1.p1  ORF type:complete len:139 (+),score=9.96 TRINITY_DN11225_c0_g1_i1:95-511(+)